MARDLRYDIGFDVDDASKIRDAANQFDDLADAAERADGTRIKLDVNAKGAEEARRELEDVGETAADIAAREVTAEVHAEVTAALGELAEVRDALGMVDRDAEVSVSESGAASTEGALDRVESAADAVEQSDPNVDVDATGVDELLDKLGELPGRFGEAGAALSDALKPLQSKGLAVGGALAIGAAFLAAAEHASDVAIEVDELRRLTGDTAEDASRLSSVWKQSGADAKDLQDVLLQMNGVLSTSPELADRLGINLDDGATVGERFRQVVQALNSDIGDTAERSQVASQVFGEEGVRQVNSMIASVGDLDTALAEVAEGSIIDDEEIANAREMKAQVRELKEQFVALATEIGTKLIPILNRVSDVVGVLPGLLDAAFGGDYSNLPGPLNAIGDAFERITSFPVLKQARQMSELFTQPWKTAGDAIGYVNDQWNAWRGNIESSVDPALLAELRQRKLNEEMERQAVAAEIAAAAGDVLAQAQAAEEQAIADTTEALAAQTEAFQRSIDGTLAYQQAISSTDWGAESLNAAASGMSEFTEQHFALANIAQAGAEAERDFVAAVKASGFSFDVATEKGAAAQDALEKVAASLDTRLVAAFAEADGSFREFNRQATTIADETLARLGSELGLNAEQTEQLRAELGLMPEDIRTRYELSGAAEAQARLGLLQSAIELLPENVAVTVNQQIAMGDYEGALATVQDYYAGENVTATAEADTAPLEKQLADATKRERRARIIADADPSNANKQLEAARARERVAIIDAEAKPGNAEARLEKARATHRVAVIEAQAEPGNAEKRLEAARARLRVAMIDADANPGDAERELEETRARERIAEIRAKAETGSANAALEVTARPRDSDIEAIPVVGAAESALNNAARDRISYVTQIVRSVAGAAISASGGGGGGGRMAPGALTMTTLDATAEPEAATSAMAPAALGATQLAPARIEVVAPRRPVNVTIQAAVIGNRFDVQRAVRQAMKESERLNGTRRYG